MLSSNGGTLFGEDDSEAAFLFRATNFQRGEAMSGVTKKYFARPHARQTLHHRHARDNGTAVLFQVTDYFGEATALTEIARTRACRLRAKTSSAFSKMMCSVADPDFVFGYVVGGWCDALFAGATGLRSEASAARRHNERRAPAD
jgi:hypothetical protein